MQTETQTICALLQRPE